MAVNLASRGESRRGHLADAGLIRAARLLPLLSLFAGRIVSHTLYVNGASMVKSAEAGEVLTSQLAAV